MSRSVLIDGRLLDRGGIGRYVRALLEGLPSVWQGEVRAIVPASAELPRGVEALRLEADVPLFGWRGFFRDRAFREPASIIHFPHFPLPRRWNATHVVITVHDLIHLEVAGVVRSPLARLYIGGLLSRAVRLADRVIVPSNATRQSLETRFRGAAGKTRMIPMGVSLERFRSREPRGEDLAGHWLNVTNGKSHKNIPRLLEAFSLSSARCLVVAGDLGSHEGAARRKAEALKLGDRVLWMGRVTDSELVDLYRMARAVIIPSLGEGFGLPALEGFAAGVPVVAARVGGLPEVCAGAALEVDPEDVAAMTRAIDRVERDTTLRASLIAAGRARAAELTWQATVTRTAALYDELLESGARQ
ncbi:MAG: glycosyltransferase family 1 protein [Planctomycetota bacterium]